MEIGSLSPIAPELARGPEILQEPKPATTSQREAQTSGEALSLDRQAILLGVVAHNSSKEIARLFASLKDQAAEFEVLVVDNASRPEEQESLRRLCAEQPFPVRLEIRERNNLAAARNRIYAASEKYEYLGYCDSDVELPAGWLKRARQGLHDNPGWTAISGPAHIPQQTSVWARVLKDLSASYVMNLGSPQNVREVSHANVDHLPCSAVLFHRSKLNEKELFNEKLAVAGEDLEMGLRLRAENHEFAFQDELGFLHHTRIQTLRQWAQRCFELGRGRIQVLRLQPQIWKTPAILLPVSFGALAFISLICFILVPEFGFSLLALYLIAVFGLGFYRAGSFAPEATLMLIATHISYAGGQWTELLGPYLQSRKSGSFSLRKDAFSHGQILSKIQLCELLEKTYSNDEQRFKRVYVLAGWAGLLPFLMRARMNRFFDQIILVDRDARVCEQARQINNTLECESRFQARCEDVLKFDFAAEKLGPDDLIINTSMEHFEDWSWLKKIPQGTHLAIQTSDLPHHEHLSPVGTLADLKDRLERERIEILERKSDELLIEYPDLSYRRVTLIGPRWGLS